MTDKTYNVLFLCNANSARSLMAEAIIERESMGRFKGFSAGAHPSGAPHPETLALLERLNYDTGFARSKSWEEFGTAEAPAMDFVFTVCDQAAAEECPVWPGQPMSAHWGVADPVKALEGGNAAEVAVAFNDTYRMLRNRISIFVNLQIDALDTLSLQKQLDEIGQNTNLSEAE